MNRPGLILVLVGFVLAGCGGGPRPTLEEGTTLNSSARALASELTRAPTGTPELEPASTSSWPTTQDALDEWALDIALDYRGDCTNPEPEGMGARVLCSTSAEARNVIHLGPTAESVWYVITFAESADGFRVNDTAIAGAAR